MHLSFETTGTEDQTPTVANLDSVHTSHQVDKSPENVKRMLSYVGQVGVTNGVRPVFRKQRERHLAQAQYRVARDDSSHRRYGCIGNDPGWRNHAVPKKNGACVVTTHT